VSALQSRVVERIGDVEAFRQSLLAGPLEAIVRKQGVRLQAARDYLQAPYKPLPPDLVCSQHKYAFVGCSGTRLDRCLRDTTVMSSTADRDRELHASLRSLVLRLRRSPRSVATRRARRSASTARRSRCTAGRGGGRLRAPSATLQSGSRLWTAVNVRQLLATSGWMEIILES
jgi:hypothetical protein